MEHSRNHNELAEIIVKKLRDENFEQFLKSKDYAKSMSSEKYWKKPRNPNLDKELQKLLDERFDFLNRLSERDSGILERMILNILDSTAFNFLREIEENLEENKSIGLSINGEKVEKITTELLSGTLFGEYFLWLEKNSKYGNFQQ
ncbi:hypothetical protein [uncultured Aquimarina sp.]|uniref:hypothetical protein n=1 Tax=uncultured Aquimarina sp. TaxID=575652 RepID=UPI0026208438|nr:hypothetical protein [uncultured Aquimarina sp.]